MSWIHTVPDFPGLDRALSFASLHVSSLYNTSSYWYTLFAQIIHPLYNTYIHKIFITKPTIKCWIVVSRKSKFRPSRRFKLRIVSSERELSSQSREESNEYRVKTKDRGFFLSLRHCRIGGWELFGWSGLHLLRNLTGDITRGLNFSSSNLI